MYKGGGGGRFVYIVCEDKAGLSERGGGDMECVFVECTVVCLCPADSR